MELMYDSLKWVILMGLLVLVVSRVRAHVVAQQRRAPMQLLVSGERIVGIICWDGRIYEHADLEAHPGWRDKLLLELENAVRARVIQPHQHTVGAVVRYLSSFDTEE